MTDFTLVTPERVHPIIDAHMLNQSLPLVIDVDRSHRCLIHDALTGREYFDFFSFYASNPLGFGHPGLKDPAFLDCLTRAAALSKPASNISTPEMATFVEALSRQAMPAELPHLFVAEGGSVAVENAVKVAIDWKVRKNLAAGRGELGKRIIHFQRGFHGRTGYSLSLTSTPDRRKTKYFPLFDWPRVSSPSIRFPLEGRHLEETLAAEARSVGEMEQAFLTYQDDIAAIIIEPIQGEGGDNHFRLKFLARLRELADRHEAMLIFDEIQTGVGLTGKFWAFQHFGVMPDILVFGKKLQACGIMVSRRVEEVENHCFAEASRINTTWGGNIVDMVRAVRFLQIIDDEGLVDNAAAMGEVLMDRLRRLEARHPDVVSNVRGRGLMCAFDLPSAEAREGVKKAAMAEGLLLLGGGDRTIRFRPFLDISDGEVHQGMDLVERALDGWLKAASPPARL